MQMVKKFFIILALFLFSLLLFAPKKKLYYALEEELAKQDIIISDEQFEEKPFGFTIKDAKIYLKGINVAKIDEMHLLSLLFYNNLDIQGVELDKSIRTLMPSQVDSIKAKFVALYPQKLLLDINGTFGSAEGSYDLKQSKIRLDIIEEKRLGTLRAFLKKDEKGWYYENSF